MKTPRFRGKPQKVDVISKEILINESFNHELQKKIELYQNYLDELEAYEVELVTYLDHIIRLMKKKLKLRQSLKSLFIVRQGRSNIWPRVAPGDEWQITTGYLKPKRQRIAFVEEKAFPEGYMMDEIDGDIVLVNKELAHYLNNLDEKHPADSLLLELYWEYSSKENRTN
jgi:hypothetical protein